MNSKLRDRLIAKYGEIEVTKMELSFKPPKVTRHEIKFERPLVHTKRISKNVLRRRKEEI